MTPSSKVNKNASHHHRQLTVNPRLG